MKPLVQHSPEMCLELGAVVAQAALSSPRPGHTPATTALSPSPVRTALPEFVLARLAPPAHHIASVRLLRHQVGAFRSGSGSQHAEPAFGSARAAAFDRERAAVEADDSGALRFRGQGHWQKETPESLLNRAPGTNGTID